MSKDYTQFDWARDRYDRMRWADEEDRLMDRIDRKLRKSERKWKTRKRVCERFA